MNKITNELREIVKDLFNTGKVDLFIGWEKGDEPFISAPVVINNEADVDRLVFDDYCVHNLATYLLDYRDSHHKVGILAKGCDSRGIIRLIQDRQFTRERLYILGVNCPGVKDPFAHMLHASGMVAKGPSSELAAKCLGCQNPNPVLYDLVLGEPQKPRDERERLTRVIEIEGMSPDERYEFFSRELSKCIRCYACRNICVACNCRVCIFDETRPQWVGRSVDAVNNMLYHIVRCTHVAGRCVECGECERACPVGIPLMLLNRKLIKDIDQFFGPHQAGMSLEEDPIPPLSCYRIEDPDEFM